ncbi:MAG: hypothetical protein COA78_11025 [Blastopirellula sp.]|nr:MAG: hypothetical protein COA78_11025 [Blastopirellula sp.]
MAEEKMASRFSIPLTGHVECLKSVRGVELKGLELKSIDDVIKFYEKLSKVTLTEDSVSSWKFLDEAGVSFVKPGPIPPPPFRTIEEFKQPPEWRDAIVDFSGELYSLNEKINGSNHRSVSTADAEITEIRSKNGHRQINHYPERRSDLRRLDPATLFSRADRWFDKLADSSKRDKFTLYTIDYGKRSLVFLTAPAKDAIFAKCVVSKNGTPLNISLHLGSLIPGSQPNSSNFSLTCTMQKSLNSWSALFYFIRNVELNIKVDPKDFEIDLREGDIYVPINPLSKSGPIIKMSTGYRNVAKRNPEVIVENERSPWRGNSKRNKQEKPKK